MKGHCGKEKQIKGLVEKERERRREMHQSLARHGLRLSYQQLRRRLRQCSHAVVGGRERGRGREGVVSEGEGERENDRGWRIKERETDR